MKRYLIILGAVLFLMGCSNSMKNTEQNLIQNEAIESESDESVKEDQTGATEATEETKPVEETSEKEEPKETEEIIEVLNYEPGEGIITENGALQVINGQLSNSKGEAIQLKGLSSHGLQFKGSFISDGNIRRFVEEWNIDILRGAMYTAQQGYTEEAYKNLNLMRLENTIHLATKYGIYVMVDWHVLQDKDPLIHMDKAKEFFEYISTKYKNYDNIIYEICNEPNGPITWKDNVKPYAEAIIPIIRKNDSDAVIIVGSPNWSQNVDEAADDPLEFDHIMYTLHFYAGTHGQELRDKAQYALDKGLGIFVTEWGTSQSSGGGGMYEKESDVWLAFLDEHNISWCNWSISDAPESSALFKPRTDPTGKFREDQISESGLYVRRKIQE
jgi:endoglucanase